MGRMRNVLEGRSAETAPRGNVRKELEWVDLLFEPTTERPGDKDLGKIMQARILLVERLSMHGDGGRS